MLALTYSMGAGILNPDRADIVLDVRMLMGKRALPMRGTSENTVEKKRTFSFGKNWQRFLKSISQERLRNAERSLTEFLEMDDMRGMRFLDIGCGSGIFSYAAFHLGAKEIVSFDLDRMSVECCKFWRRKAGNPDNWKVCEGSILDGGFLRSLGKFDIVYSWGVLHHTGDMWRAIRNSAMLVDDDGYYYIAIYNKVEGFMGSEFWLRIKRLYNSSGAIRKCAIEAIYIAVHFATSVLRLRNPIKKRPRDMSWRTDITDWLGGYPYEFATVEEVFAFMKKAFPDFRLVNIKTRNGLENNWYLFKRDVS